MKILLLNGSPKKDGCTFTALHEMEKVFNAQNIDTEIVHIAPIQSGCIGCMGCRTAGKCVFGNDNVNPVAEKLLACDGLVVGSPVHYAAASGAVTCFLDRLFYAFGKQFSYKPACAIVSCRRGGASAAFDQLNKYFSINNMPIATSQYWNQVHGTTPSEVLQDAEGIQTMRTLANNMAWMVKCFAVAKQNGICTPEREAPVRTSFIR